MSLVRRRVTERMIAANRANARRSTGPRTVRGKAQSRLNGLRDGHSSRLYLNYIEMWLTCKGPWKLPLPWGFSKISTPGDGRSGYDQGEARSMREFLLSISACPQPAPRTRAKRRKEEELNNPFFVLGAVR